jgi:predicted small metal-binding protein
MPVGSLNGVKGSQVSRQVNCECGYVARGESDDEVVELVLEHVRRDHPDLAGTEGPAEIREWIEVVG